MPASVVTTPLSADDSEMSPEALGQTVTPLSKLIESFRMRMNDLMQEPTQEKFDSIRAEILAIHADEASHQEDACGLLHLMGYLVGAGDDGEAVWKWANALTAPPATQHLSPVHVRRRGTLPRSAFA